MTFALRSLEAATAEVLHGCREKDSEAWSVLNV